MTAHLPLTSLELFIPQAQSLKDKRAILKPLLSRVGATFNVAVAEIGFQDKWQRSQIAFVTLSTSDTVNTGLRETVVRWIENHYPDLYITQIQHETLWLH